MTRQYEDLRDELSEARQAGKDKSAIVRALSRIGAQLDYQGDFVGAQRYHEEALEIAKEALPPDSAGLAVAWHNVGANYELQKRYDNAMSAYGKAVDVWNLHKPVDKSKAAIEYFGVGRCFEGTKGYDAAVAMYQNALAKATDASLPALRLEILQELLAVLERQGRTAEAEVYSKQHQELVKQQGEKLPPSAIRGSSDKR